MLKILPTTQSGLSHASYSVSLDEGSGLDLGLSRPMGSSRTLSGETIYSLWPAKVSGKEFSTTTTATPADYAVLRSMAEHATATEWIMQVAGRSFLIGFDIDRARPGRRNGIAIWDISLRIYILEELHR
jgi:hypothetical protein